MGPYTIHYLFEDSLSTGFIEGLVKSCIEFGCTTSETGATDTCSYSSERSGINTNYDVPVDTAVSDIDESSYGHISLYYEGFRVQLEKNLTAPSVPDSPHIGLTVDLGREYQLSESDERLQGKRQRLDDLLQLAVRVAEETDPTYGYGIFEPDSAEPAFGYADTENLREGIVENLSWFNLFNKQMVERIGYWLLADAQDAAHAWRAIELSTGGIVIVPTDSPVRPTEGWRGNRERLAEHLGIPT